MKNRSERAVELFEQGFNCAQSVFAAYAEDLGIDKETALKLSSSFGGGMGRMREVCGCCSGMFLVAGMLTGSAEEGNREAKQHNYEVVQMLAEKFREQNGSISCRELLSGVQTEGEGTAVPEKRTAEYYRKRPCKELVRMAAEIIAENL